MVSPCYNHNLNVKNCTNGLFVGVAFLISSVKPIELGRFKGEETVDFRNDDHMAAASGLLPQ